LAVRICVFFVLYCPESFSWISLLGVIISALCNRLGV
jgi:hypothetical protein